MPRKFRRFCPDGVQLVKALDTPLHKIAGLDQQAAFRLSQSRMQLQLDEKPEHASLWAFSQCLLAEAETLCLMSTSTATSPQTPLKLKQLQGDAKTSSTTSPADTKMKQNATADKPCKFFLSDAGCRAGKSCKWSHSWEVIEDKASRCWSCGSKKHRKADCTVKSASKRTGEPRDGPGGGRGNSTSNATSSTVPTSSTSSSSAMGGKAGAAAVKMAKNAGE